jgi:predicted TPR repeat methyltransferase
MNRKERRRLEKQAQKKAGAAGRIQNASSNGKGQTTPTDVSNALFNHAVNSTTSTEASELDWELGQISNQLANGFTGDALASCQRLNLLHPQNSDIQLLSGIAHFMNQQWSKATECFEIVLVTDPNNAQALNYLGDLAIEQNDLTAAEDYFRRAALALPGDPETLQRLAYVLQRLDNMTDAAEIYHQLLETTPETAEIHLNYGYALFKSDQTKAAIREYRHAIKLNPDLGLAQINLGMALSELDEDVNAIAAFRQGLKSMPNHIDGLFGIARCLRAEDEYQEAADYFQKALDLAPNRTVEFWELGYSLELAGDKEGGQKAYEKCLEHNPNHSVARHLLDALLGNTTETAPQEYIAELFDDYADSFDDSLVNELNYVVPKLLKTRLAALYLEQPLQSALDLGGGTGLVAVELKEYLDPKSGIIHGVDLSSGMLDIANQKERYNETFVSDIGEFLEDKKRGIPSYQLIIAGDVFVYIGNLEQIFAGVNQRLQQNGLFLFTVEQSPAENYILQSTGRYAHSKTYVRALAKKFGFEILNIQEIVPRKDGDQDIAGFLVSLKKAS